MRNTAKEFRQFLLRGNVVDLAVAVVIGAAFGAVVQALVRDFITPIIAIPGKADFSSLTFAIHDSTFRYGDFLNTAISFLLIAFVVFFFIVKPVNHLMSMYKSDKSTDESTKECPKCISKIPIKATKCAFCTSEL